MDITMVMQRIGIICAWIAFILLLIFALKPLLRKTKKLKKLRMFLIKQHTLMGILCIISVILHIFLSHSSVYTVTGGIIATVCMIVSVVAYSFRKKLKKNFMKVHGIFALLCLLFGVWHIVETNFVFGNSYEYQPGENNFNNYTLIDGDYEGTGSSYLGHITLLVTIEDSKIVEIVVIDTDNDSEAYISKVEQSIKKHIIENQNSDVDVVSYATFTSQGYIEAVLEAVEKAKV